MTREEIGAILDDIQERSGKPRLDAEDVVAVASEPGHPLHEHFTWDNNKAAHQWRLFQARTLIRTIRITDREGSLAPPAPKYIALKQDINDGGGYRKTVDVMSDEQLAEAARATAIKELQGWLNRWRTFLSLSDLTSAVEAAAGLAEPLEVAA